MARQRKSNPLRGKQLSLFDQDMIPVEQETHQPAITSGQALHQLSLQQLQAMAAQRYGDATFAFNKAGDFAQLGENPLYRKAPWIRLLLAPTEATDLIRAASHKQWAADVCDRVLRHDWNSFKQ